MWKYVVMVGVAVFPWSLARAGAVIDLVPTEPGPYMPGERVEITVYLTQEPGGEDVYLRGIQLDFLDTDSGLVLDESFRFDYSAQAACARDPAQCGANYAEFPSLWPGPYSRPLLVATVFVGTHHDPGMQMRLPAENTITVGSIGVTLPMQPGEYVLDVLNAGEPDPVEGGRIDFGFGWVEDPITTWRAGNEATMAGGRFTASMTADAGFHFEYRPISGLIIPEPATLVLLALGGLVGVYRRRAGAEW